jgi:hypothetical protein
VVGSIPTSSSNQINKKRMPIKKNKTNEQMFRSLLKELEGSIFPALLRERIVNIMELTVYDIKNNPKQWERSFIHPSMYEELNKIVQKHLGFSKEINDKTK